MLAQTLHRDLLLLLRLTPDKLEESESNKKTDVNAPVLIRNSKQPILPHLSQHLRRLRVVLEHLHGHPVVVGALRREARTTVDARKTTAAKEKHRSSQLHTDQCRRVAE
jgi:hypothetical protein